MLHKPQSDFLIASDVTYSKTVARGSNAHRAAADTTIPKSCAEEEQAKREPKAEEKQVMHVRRRVATAKLPAD
jgi:hypothetical protein